MKIMEMENTWSIEEPIQPRIHPLLIDHVLENVLEYLPANSEGLNRTRMVCSQWNYIASKVIKQSKEMTLGKFACNNDRIRSFIEIFKNSQVMPIRRFKFCQDIFQNQNEELLYDFFDVCSATIESLVIWLDIKSTLLFYEKCFKNLDLPRLKCLTFDDRRLLDDSNYNLIGGNFLRALFAASPNLTEVNLIFQREAVLDVQKCKWMTDVVVKIFTEYAPRKLKHLKLDLHINDDLLYCLSGLNFKLLSLNLCIRDSCFSKDALKTLLVSLKFTLETLRFSYLYKRSNLSIEWPRMEKLSCLEIRGWDNSTMDVNFSPFSYEKHLPRLKKLYFNTWANKPDWHQFFPSRYSNSVLNTLKLSEDLSTPDMVLQVSDVFPNLKRLEICLSLTSLSVLEIVFEYMKNLEELKVNKYSSYWENSLETIDHVFTGITPEHCARLLKLKNISHLDCTKLQSKPSLVNLKKLRKLEMKDLQYQAVLTDVTGYLAFLQMENLVYLDVGRSQIEEECLHELAKKFPNNMLQQMNMPKMIAKSLCNDNDNPSLPGRCIFL